MTITVAETISMGHRLPTYDGICSSLHGHNVRVEVSVWTQTFLDFKQVSNRLREVLEPLDHAMVLHDVDPVIATLRATLPEQRLVLLNVEPTTEHLAAYVYQQMRDLIYDVLSVTVHETAKYSATCCGEERAVKRTA